MLQCSGDSFPICQKSKRMPPRKQVIQEPCGPEQHRYLLPRITPALSTSYHLLRAIYDLLYLAGSMRYVSTH